MILKRREAAGFGYEGGDREERLEMTQALNLSY